MAEYASPAMAQQGQRYSRSPKMSVESWNRERPAALQSAKSAPPSPRSSVNPSAGKTIRPSPRAPSSMPREAPAASVPPRPHTQIAASELRAPSKTESTSRRAPSKTETPPALRHAIPPPPARETRLSFGNQSTPSAPQSSGHPGASRAKLRRLAACSRKACQSHRAVCVEHALRAWQQLSEKPLCVPLAPLLAASQPDRCSAARDTRGGQTRLRLYKSAAAWLLS